MEVGVEEELGMVVVVVGGGLISSTPGYEELELELRLECG